MVKTELTTRDAIEEKVREVVVRELDVTEERVTLEASFVEDLGADSLDTVELVMGLEEEFGMDIPDADAEPLKTVGDAVSYVARAYGLEPHP